MVTNINLLFINNKKQTKQSSLTLLFNNLKSRNNTDFCLEPLSAHKIRFIVKHDSIDKSISPI